MQNARLTHVFPKGWDTYVFIVTRDDDVFAIGDDALALGRKDERNPDEPRKIGALCQQKIKSFTEASLGGHFAALSEDGRLFLWGYNGSGQLGDGSYDHNPTPKCVKGGLDQKKVVQVACGMSHTMALTEQGQVFFWGQNQSNNRTSEWPERITAAIGDRRAVAVACNVLSSFVLLEDGQLYGWGGNSSGQLGIGDLDPPFNPVFIDYFSGKKIKQVVCGYYHYLALTDLGEIFACGYNTYGQVCGNEIRYYDYKKSVLVAGQFGKALEIAASCYRSAAKFEDGTVRAWGLRDPATSGLRVRLRSESWLEFGSIDEAFAPHSMWRTLDWSLVPKTVAEEMNVKLGDQKTADISFQVGDKQIWAHKQVLMKCSVYFDKMFQSHWPESNNTKWMVHYSYSYDTFYAFLNYLYTEELMPNINWEDLRILATYYMHYNLQHICRREIDRMSDGEDEYEEDEYDQDEEWEQEDKYDDQDEQSEREDKYDQDKEWK